MDSLSLLARVFSLAVYLVLACILPRPTAAQFSQQGNKLVGMGAVGSADQGYSVGLSGDGNTAIVGAPYDNGYTGAAWIYSRTNGVWTQQGGKLIGSVAQRQSQQGSSVAISADGNTAILGGPMGRTGGAWVFTRSAGVWTQQGEGLVGSVFCSDIPGSQQGYSVALSADGNTAMIGGPMDCSSGAVWVFSRSNGVWTQQGNKLHATPSRSFQGSAVALSGDGNTGLIGSPYDNGYAGAVWVFTRSNGVWTQQGSKLVAGDVTGLTYFGQSVALSGDGNTALVGTRLAEEARIFTRTNGVWDPQGTKLVGAGETGNGLQGFSVSLSSDGNTALVGGPQDDTNTGAAWVFTQTNGVWSQMGNKLVGAGVVGSAWAGSAVAISGDGNTALVGGPQDDAKYLNLATGAAWVFARIDPKAVEIGALVNAASLSQGLGAPNTIMSAFGNFPGCKDAAQVLVDGVATSVFYSSAAQVNFLLPPSVAGEPSASVGIACGGVSSKTVILPIAAAAPALFTVTQNGIGQAAVINQDGSVATPSPVGTSISLFGTGFGVLGQPGPDGLARLTLPITASIGVLPMTVLYAGEAPGYTSGLQQINVQLPVNMPRGPRIDIHIVAGAISTQAGVTLNVP